MMKRKATLLLGFGLVFVLSGILMCEESKTFKDIIFVKQAGKEGVFSEITGEIVDITSSKIILKVDGKRSLYTREVVKRVELDKAHKKEYHDYVDIYWNKEKSLIVAAVQETPAVGPILSLLDNLPGAAGSTLAVLILLALLSYGVYRLYQVIVVATNIKNLSRTKLNLEIHKLRFEVGSMKKELGLAEEVAPDEIQKRKIDLEAMLYSFKLPEFHLADFFKFKIFRMLTEEEKKYRTGLWQKKWQAFKEKPSWQRTLFYYARLSMNLLATVLVAMFSMGAFTDIFLPFINPEFFDGASPLISTIFLFAFLFSFAFLLRLNTQRRIMRKTYLEART